MRELNHSIHAFIDALHEKKPVRLTTAGKWCPLSRISYWAERLTGQEAVRAIELLKAFILALDRLEAIPVNFSRVPGMNVSQRADFHGYLSAAQSLKKYVQEESSSQMKAALDRLKYRTLGLLYRLEEENGGLHLAEKNTPLMACLASEAEKWKRKEKVFWKIELSEGEVHALERSVQYLAFTKNLLQDASVREDFFAWVLRDGLPPEVYIQFPALKEKIIQSRLSGRIGRMGENFLHMRKVDSEEGELQKVVTLPFEGVDISLLDENKEVIFKGNYRVKIKHVLHVFRDKHKDLGNFEMFAEGSLNWNSNCMGWWDNDLCAYQLVNLERRDWWRQLPVLEVLTFEEARRRFGVDLDGSKWVLAAKSARESVSLDYDGCHAYIEMAVPTSDQYYVIYTFGKAATELPRNFWHRLFLFGAHVPATIVYPDENMYFTHRQQIGYSFEMNEEEGLRLMDAFKEDIRRAREGNMVFQIEAENCGKWIQNHLEEHLGKERVPNLYRFPILEAEPNGLMAKFFSFFQALPRFCRNRLFILIHYPLGAWRGKWVVDKQGQKVWKSLINSSFWKDAVTYMPAYLHKQHEIGVFAEDAKHKVWVENTQAAQKKRREPPSSDNISLFEEIH
jgi:hypothetical protein